VRPFLIKCHELAAAGPPEARKAIRRVLRAAKDTAPALIILDDLAALLPTTESIELPPGGVSGQPSHKLALWLGEVMDTHAHAAAWAAEAGGGEDDGAQVPRLAWLATCTVRE
jgi:hypothetical protein